MFELNIDKNNGQIHLGSYTTYLIQDMSTLFAEYSGEVGANQQAEISKKVEYLVDSYHRVVGAVFGIRFTIKHKRLDIFLYPIK